MRIKKRIISYITALLLTAALALQGLADTSQEALISQGPGVYNAGPWSVSSGSASSDSGSSGSISAGTGKVSALADGQKVGLDPSWNYADFSVIHTGQAVFYRAAANRKNITVAVNAGHGTRGGESRKTYSHPDKTPKVTGGTNPKGVVMSTSISSGMTFRDGTPEKTVTLRMAQILRDKLLAQGYDVLMLRDGEDVQLDNVARTVIANNNADIHIALHWDGDGLKTIKGAFYMSVPDGLKTMEPVASLWQKHEALGDSLIKGLETKISGIRIFSSSGHGQLDTDLTQTSYSTIPSVDIELGNQCSAHDDTSLSHLADGLVEGIQIYFQN